MKFICFVHFFEIRTAKIHRFKHVFIMVYQTHFCQECDITGTSTSWGLCFRGSVVLSLGSDSITDRPCVYTRSHAIVQNGLDWLWRPSRRSFVPCHQNNTSLPCMLNFWINSKWWRCLKDAVLHDEFNIIFLLLVTSNIIMRFYTKASPQWSIFR